MKFIKISVICLLIISTSLIINAQNQNIPNVTIGVLLDGPWEKNDEILNMLKAEVKELTEREFNVEFPAEKTIDCEWSVKKMESSFDAMLDDPSVDIIIPFGEVLSEIAVFRTDLKKPVIVPVAVNAGIRGIPIKNGSSGVKNLNYNSFTSELESQIETFLELKEFKNAVLLMNRFYIDALNRRTIPRETFQLSGVNLHPLPVDENIFSYRERVPADIDAVVSLPLFYLDTTQQKRLVRYIKEKGLPHFSIFDINFVDYGAVAGLRPKDFWSRLTRRIAINIQRILLGDKPEDIPVKMPIEMELVINLETAREQKIFPSWELLSEARMINEKRKDMGRSLQLQDAILEAAEVNLDLAAKQEEVLAGEQRVDISRSVLFPQIDLSATGVLIDKDRAERSLGTQSEQTITGSASLYQIIYADEAWAGYTIEGLSQDIRIYEQEQLRLDVVLDAATSYLNILRAKSFEDIEKQNRTVSSSNLEIAKFRVDVGFASPSEVYRWESEIANNRKSVIEANAARNIAEINLNRILNRPSEEDFTTHEEDLDELIDIISDSRVQQYFNDKWSFKVFRGYLASRAFEYSPEINIINKAIDIQERIKTSAYNAFYLPTVGLSGSANYTFYRGGAGSDIEPVEIPGFGQIGFMPEDFYWDVGINLSLPLFTGLSRTAELQRSKLEISRLELEKKSLETVIEQILRSSVHSAGASYAGLKQAEFAAEAAARSYEIVVESYTQGAVSIVELIDAQRATLVANQVAAHARFDFLIDLMNMQRALGRFAIFWTDEEREAFFSDLNAYYDENIGTVN
jgi:outer membrane protein TolC/ABC-type uncharacterized transport system substrate-binding protein